MARDPNLSVPLLRVPLLRVLFLEPFDGGSHRAFARGWAARSYHHVTLETLPARFWKWRLRGAAFAFAERLARGEARRRETGEPRQSRGRPAIGAEGGAMRAARLRPRGRSAPELPQRGRRDDAVPLDAYDAVVATSLMNAADFLACTRLDLPLIVYFHENQLSYPRPPTEPLDHGLALAALSSAAAADAVVFNSRFHRKAFFLGLSEWTARFPESPPRRTARAIRARSSVIHPGIDWEAISPLAERVRPRGGPLILWNHRWEFDKNPGAFFAALTLLASRGWEFRVALLGESTQAVPKPFLEARERLGPRIVRYGHVASEAGYRGWLGRADIVVSTAWQENFGLSVAEAVAAGAFPLLPARLSYPELLPGRLHEPCLYRSQSDLVRKLERLLAHPDRLAEGRLSRSRAMRRYDWSTIAPALDALVAGVVRAGDRSRPSRNPRKTDFDPKPR